MAMSEPVFICELTLKDGTARLEKWVGEWLDKVLTRNAGGRQTPKTNCRGLPNSLEPAREAKSLCPSQDERKIRGLGV